jgi:hypothetical protein
MEVIEVDDIKVAKGGAWRSLRDQKVAKNGAWNTFGTGSGIAKNGNWYVLKSMEVPKVSAKITGIVVDEYGDPVIGCSILLEGSVFGTISDMSGSYYLSVQIIPGSSVLLFSFVGMHTVRKVIPSGGNVTINVTMYYDE